MRLKTVAESIRKSSTILSFFDLLNVAKMEISNAICKMQITQMLRSLRDALRGGAKRLRFASSSQAI